MSNIDRHLRPMLFRNAFHPDEVEEIMALSDKTKQKLFRVLTEAESSQRRSRQMRRFM